VSIHSWLLKQRWVLTLLGGMNIYTDDRQRESFGIHDVIDSGGQIWSDEYRFLLADNSRLGD